MPIKVHGIIGRVVPGGDIPESMHAERMGPDRWSLWVEEAAMRKFLVGFLVGTAILAGLSSAAVARPVVMSPVVMWSAVPPAGSPWPETITGQPQQTAPMSRVASPLILAQAQSQGANTIYRNNERPVRPQRYICVVPPQQSDDRNRPYVCRTNEGRVGGTCRCDNVIGSGRVDLAD